MAELKEIENLAKEYSNANEALTDIKRDANSEIEKIRTKYFKQIKNAVEKVMKIKGELFDAIEDSPDLFIKPKTLVIAGVKVGFKKSKDSLVWDDAERVVQLIEKHIDKETFPEEIADQLIKIEKTPLKEAIARLDEKDIKKIGCRIEPGTDEVVIKSIDTEIDKFINSLMKEAA